MGTALGLALLGSLATLMFREHDNGWSFGDTLGETLHRSHDMGSSGGALADAAKEAFVSGIHAASLAAVIALGVLGVILAVVMRTPRSVGQPEQDASPSA